MRSWSLPNGSKCYVVLLLEKLFQKTEGERVDRGQSEVVTVRIQDTLDMLCYVHEDLDRRLNVTVKFGKENSPSSLMDHMRIHHHQEYITVVVVNIKNLFFFFGGFVTLFHCSIILCVWILSDLDRSWGLL